MTECEEIALDMPLPTRRLSFADAWAIVETYMAWETNTVRSNVAQALMEKSWRMYPTEKELIEHDKRDTTPRYMPRQRSNY